MGRSFVSLVVVGAALVVGGCDEAASPEVDGFELDIEAAEEVVGPMAYDEDLDDYVVVDDYDEGKVLNYIKGKHLFEKETFDGNGRTCATCHTRKTGKLAPDEIQALWDDDPSHPIFRALDSDDGLGATYDRLRTMGTIRVGVDLPDNVTLVDDPSQRKVVVNRGIPSTLDTPALDPVLMYDGRQPDLAAQADGAIHDHAAPGREPSAEELGLIAAFQQTFSFYSSIRTFIYAKGGPAPHLPQGATASEKRGREWFVDSPTGLCSHCHSGPMLNQTNEFLFLPLAPGSRFVSVAVSEFNTPQNPVYTFAFANPEDPDEPVLIDSPDPGRALITGDPADANAFKIPSLRGLSKRGGPYFHDASAKTLEDVTEHYAAYFALPPANLVLTEQEKADITAYMKLL